MAALRDGKGLLTGGPDGLIRVWNPADAKVARTIPVPVGTEAIALSADEKLLAVAGSDRVVRILNVADGKEVHALKGHAGAISAVAFVPDHKIVVTAAEDGTARVWTLPVRAGDEAPSRTLGVGPKKPVRAMVVLPGGRSILTADDDATARVFDLADGKETRSFPLAGGPALALAVDRDGTAVLVGSDDKSARLYDLAPRASPAETYGPHGGPVRAVGFAARGDRVVTGGDDGMVKVWERSGGRGVISFAQPAVKAGDPRPEGRAGLLPRRRPGRFGRREDGPNLGLRGELVRGPDLRTARLPRPGRSTSARMASSWPPAAASRRGRER